MSLKHTMLNKRRHTKEDLLYNPTCESVEQANWAIVTEGRSEVALGWGWRIPDLTARDKRTSWGDGHILHLDQGNGYMGISTCQNPLDCTLKMGALHWGLCILSCVWLLATPWTVACQGPLSMGFPRQEYWNGLPFHSPGIFPIQGLNSQVLSLLLWQVDSLPLAPPGKSE